jgi:hypothetical protein
VTHTCNPSNSGGRNQEDHGLKPSPGKQFVRPYLKNTCYKKGWWSGSKDPEFKPQYHKKKKKKKENM